MVLLKRKWKPELFPPVLFLDKPPILIVKKDPPSKNEVSQGDYYFENGFMVFTEAFHLKRGYCCQSGCRHCPYGFKDKKGK